MTSDKHALVLLKRKLPKVMSFSEAYRSWWKSGRRDIEELGEGLSFLKWLKANGLSVAFRRSDFHLHPYFQPSGTKDSEQMFTITPVTVLGRKVKLFVEDEDMIQILHFPYGRDVDFLVAVRKYVAMRFQWELWRAPAPKFVDWLRNSGLRPIYFRDQVGINLVVE